MMQRLRNLLGGLVGFLLATAVAWATTITWSHTFSDGEVLTASMLETMKTDITNVVNVGGGPVSLTSAQTVSGDKTFSGTNTHSGAATFSGTVTVTGSISGASPLIFEGSTANDYELTLAVPDPTADVTYTLQGSASVSSTIKSWQNAGTADVSLVWEGATADDYETTWTVTDPTADRTHTFGNEDLNFPEQAIKGWCIFNGSAGSISCDDSYRVNAITDLGGTGNYRIDWTPDFASANYAVVCNGDTNSADEPMICAPISFAAGTTDIEVIGHGGSSSDCNPCTVMAIGNY